LRRNGDTRLLFVNDCSVDDTQKELRALESELGPQISVLSLPQNMGKAEAVRAGMQAALADRPLYAGFWDADLSTPLEAISEFRSIMEERPDVVLVLGSRVRLLGRSIRRSPLRHYVGRVFATAASMALRLPVYDTQCGAKLFRAGPAVNDLFRDPFLSRWAFDVEVIARLLRSKQRLSSDERMAQFYELPLKTWEDVPGSKVRALDFPRSILDLLRIHWRYFRGSNHDAS
jgi:glycosyltransferase involved in cell wall biosynthesis